MFIINTLNKKFSPSTNSTFFRFCWWNGGGKIRTRLRTNPELHKLLAKCTDIFIYGEAQTHSPENLSVDGYICYLHKAKLNSPNNYRRGLTIFYRTKYRFLLTKVYASRQYDIVWVRLVAAAEHIHFCFFYAPGSLHPLPIRKKFYDISRISFQNLLP